MNCKSCGARDIPETAVGRRCDACVHAAATLKRRLPYTPVDVDGVFGADADGKRLYGFKPDGSARRIV